MTLGNQEDTQDTQRVFSKMSRMRNDQLAIDYPEAVFDFDLFRLSRSLRVDPLGTLIDHQF